VLQKGKGTGLGLYISNQIIRRHGGRMGVVSQVGKGSTFFAEIPVRVVSQTAECESTATQRFMLTEPPGPGGPARDRDAAAAAAAAAGGVGAGAGEAAAAELAGAPLPAVREGTEETEAGEGERRAGVLTGLEGAGGAGAGAVAGTGAAAPPGAAAGPVGGTTAPAAAAAIHGPPAHALPPGPAPPLGPAAAAAAAPPLAAAAAAAGPQPPSTGGIAEALPVMRHGLSAVGERRLSILVVDDAPTNRMFLVRALRRNLPDARIGEAENGALACDMVLPDVTGWDVILMDKEMPVMDGWQATRSLRDAGYTGVVLGVTGNALAEDTAAFVAAGADAVLIKPVTMPVLLAEIQRRLGGGHRAGGGGGGGQASLR
jgi:CheY-like chemotaxis protein